MRFWYPIECYCIPFCDIFRPFLFLITLPRQRARSGHQSSMGPASSSMGRRRAPLQILNPIDRARALQTTSSDVHTGFSQTHDRFKRNVVMVVFGQATGAVHVSIVDLMLKSFFIFCASHSQHFNSIRQFLETELISSRSQIRMCIA